MGLSRRARVLGSIGGVLIVLLIVVASSTSLQFELGAALIDLGYRFQDPIDWEEGRSADAILSQVYEHNALAADVRGEFPRSVHHPVVAMVVCMDARIDTSELVGDTRRYYYVLRLAGSVMSEREEEMLELAAANGVEVILLTSHTDCAAEAVAADPARRALYPSIAAGLDERERRWAEFAARPAIASRIADGSLRVVHARIDTSTGRMTPSP